MPSLRRALGALALLACCALSTTPLAAQPALQKVRVVTPPIDAGSEPYYGRTQGFFRKHGIDLEISQLSSGAAVAAAVAGGSADIGQSNVPSVAAARQRGIPLVFIAAANAFVAAQHQSALVVAPNAALRGAKDLVGKTVAVSGLKNITEVGLDEWLEQNHVDRTKVNVVEMPFSAMAEAVAKGRVAAAMMTEPGLTEALKDRTVRALAYPLEAIGKRFLVGGWFTTESWAKAHPDLVAAFDRAMRETAAWSNAHQTETAKILERVTKQPMGSNASRVVFAESLDPQEIQPVLDASARYGALKRSFAASELIFTPGVATSGPSR